MLSKSKYFRRRQYILGPEYIDYEGWHHVEFDEKFALTVHPDLTVTLLTNNANKALLLGYAIDPYDYKMGNEEILRRFVHGNISLDSIVAGLEKLSGRFVLIIKCQQGSWLFPDACALRQTTFCIDQSNEVWCASQPEILAERFGYRYDEEVLSYRKDAYSDGKEEFWFINDRTPYREVKYLLANHYLDLQNGQVVRFWPTANCLQNLSIKESVILSSPILQNSIKAATERFDLKMGITAGSDSRRSLAASKAIAEKIVFFTHEPRTASKNADLKVPVRLLPKLGLVHHQLSIKSMSNDFRELYQVSATWARERRGQVAYTALKYFGPNVTILNSNLSEIHECWYWIPKSKINGESLAVVTRLNHPFAVEQFQKWLEDAKASCEISGMNILVLFDYELRSRWAAAAFYEFDIAHETFNPYNNRYLSCLELSINERYRSGQRLDVIKAQIRHMWPEVLVEPINPETTVLKKCKNYILTCFIHKLITPWVPLYQYIKYLKLKLFFYHKHK